MRTLLLSVMLLIGVTFWGNALAFPVIHHQFEVSLNPAAHSLSVEDTLQFPHDMANHEFTLHEGLTVEVVGAELKPLEVINAGVPLQRYRLMEVTSAPVILRYSGQIYHPPSQDVSARGFSESPGNIDEQGVFLAETSGWYPQFDGAMNSFEMNVKVPARWSVVSQGRRTGKVGDLQSAEVSWLEPSPQLEIYLIAAQFNEYTAESDTVSAMVFLREPDPELAQRYLDATAQYIEMYSELIGPYPYSKFALVENIWQTGYGMPSFTLLGSRVIRLPFILYTSYPHEILHNWWGNGVYVDYDKGNWAEGLTSYLADQLFQQQRGSDANFRRNILQGYADFVDEAKDFALTDFRSRHSASSEAVGYGKTQMLFHMLRQKLGDEGFVEGLQHLYRDNRFQIAGWKQVVQAFESVSHEPLSDFFTQWVNRVGAPQLQLHQVRRERTQEGWLLKAQLQQGQPGEAYQLEVPIAITLQGVEQAKQMTVTMQDKSLTLALPFEAKPLRIDIDPQYDLFRRLDRAEIPPALSQAFGADKMLMVLPALASKELVASYQQLIAQWRVALSSEIEVIFDNQLTRLPKDKAVWLLGWQNRFLPQLLSLAAYGVEIDEKRVVLDGTEYRPDQHAVVVADANPQNPELALVWLAAESQQSMTGLARKLPHYRKYSFLVFEGEGPDNIVKGQWQVNHSPLNVVLENEPVTRGVLAKRAPLVTTHN